MRFMPIEINDSSLTGIPSSAQRVMTGDNRSFNEDVVLSTQDTSNLRDTPTPQRSSGASGSGDARPMKTARIEANQDSDPGNLHRPSANAVNPEIVVSSPCGSPQSATCTERPLVRTPPSTTIMQIGRQTPFDPNQLDDLVLTRKILSVHTDDT